MAYIEHLHGVAIGGRMTSVDPTPLERPLFTVTAAALPANITRLLEKHGLDAPAVGKKMSLPVLDKALSGRSINERLMAKGEFARAGLI